MLLYFLSTTETVLNLAVVTQIDVALQTVEKRIMIVVQVGIVDDKGIKLIARLKAPYPTEESACRLGGYPEGLGER